MGGKKLEHDSSRLWELARTQHGVVSRAQLLGLGFGSRAIEHRLAKGRLHRLWRGVYAVGRPEVSEHGRWMGAVLSCGPSALLSHRSAARLWGLETKFPGIEVVTPLATYRRRPGIRVHQRTGLGPEHRREVDGIPVTDVVSTLVDFASCAQGWEVERAINEADRLDLVDVEALRATIQTLPPRPGMACMRCLLGLDALTDTGLERKFLAIARAARVPEPETQVWLHGYRVDFYWPRLGLVVETDGWRYHRTPAEQASDQRRDQVHTAAGLTTLRFPEEQIRHRRTEAARRLAAVVRRLAATPGDSGGFGVPETPKSSRMRKG
jgi:very-short-patch-repair endonuclease